MVRRGQIDYRLTVILLVKNGTDRNLVCASGKFTLTTAGCGEKLPSATASSSYLLNGVLDFINHSSRMSLSFRTYPIFVGLRANIGQHQRSLSRPYQQRSYCKLHVHSRAISYALNRKFCFYVKVGVLSLRLSPLKISP